MQCETGKYRPDLSVLVNMNWRSEGEEKEEEDEEEVEERNERRGGRGKRSGREGHRFWTTENLGQTNKENIKKKNAFKIQVLD